MQFLIFTEGGAVSGAGHITRCLSFCSALSSKSINASIIIKIDDEGGDEILNGINTAGLNIEKIDWHDINKLKRYINELKSFAGRDNRNENADGIINVIADSYKAEPKIYRYLCSISKDCMFCDDFNRIKYPCGFVLNGAISAAKLNYPKAGAKVKYLLGPKYQPVRSEFNGIKHAKIKSEISKIILTCGAAAPATLYSKILKAVYEILPAAEVNIVTGNPFIAQESIKAPRGLKTVFYSRLDAARMAALISSCDAAISACGQTLYELSLAGVPTVAFITAENQENNAAGFVESGAIEYCGKIHEVDFEIKLKKALSAVLNYKRRLELKKRAVAIIDGKGAARCLKEVFGV